MLEMWEGGGIVAMSAWPENSAFSGSFGESMERRIRYSPWPRHVCSSLCGWKVSGCCARVLLECDTYARMKSMPNCGSRSKMPGISGTPVSLLPTVSSISGGELP